MNVILIHGKDADPTQKWDPWLRKEIEEKTGKSLISNNNYTQGMK